MQEESPCLGHSEFHRESSAAEAGIATKGGLRAVAVIVAHGDIAIAHPLEEHNSIGPDARAACSQGSNGLGVFKTCGRPRTLRALRGIEHDEVVSRAGDLVKMLAFWPLQHQTLPINPHQRRRQTIQTASRTIFFDILLTPSVRSTKMIGISTRRKPRFQARKDISI